MNSTLDMIGQRIFVGDRVVWVDPDDGTTAFAVGRIIEISERRGVTLKFDNDFDARHYIPTFDADQVIAVRNQALPVPETKI